MVNLSAQLQRNYWRDRDKKINLIIWPSTKHSEVLIIDIVFAVLMILAIINGYRNGFIVAILSVIALIVGLAAAIKLSAIVAGYLDDTVNISSKWLPVISFILVFLVVVLIVRLGAAALQKTLELVMLGWLNRLAGVVLYVLLYTVIYSVVLFYAQQLNLLTDEVTVKSNTYGYIQPWGPKTIDAMGSVLPLFKNMFQELQAFFERIAAKKT